VRLRTVKLSTKGREYDEAVLYLTTARLTLRRFTPDDLDDLAALDADPEVMRYITGGRPIPRDEIADVVLPGYIAAYQRWAAFGTWVAQDEEGFAGWFALKPTKDPQAETAGTTVELGYRLARDRWGRGYATEGSIALIRKAFIELNVRRVVAQTMTVNAASRGVMEKAGLVYVRTFSGDWDEVIPGREQGDVWYAADRDEWLTRFGSR
jgi:RimJ/RimL family protein N-acetyltransferase